MFLEDVNQKYGGQIMPDSLLLMSFICKKNMKTEMTQMHQQL